MSRRIRLVSVLVTVVTVVTVVMTVAAGEADRETVSINCQRCRCHQDGSVFSLRCQLTGTENVLLDDPDPLDFSSRTLYFRVENASSLYVGESFLNALRRYYSVAVDLWTIGNLTFATEFRPKNRFLFMGLGIVNSSLRELPQGVISHSGAVGLRLSGSRVGVIRRGAFALVSKVRYIELTDSQVELVEGPQIGELRLSHRRHVHHGSSGLQVHNCSIGAVQEGAISVDTQIDDEFVEITDTTIAEIGPGGLSVTGLGYVIVNHTVFSYLATGALDISARGGISLLHSRVSVAAPVPLWRVRGGNDTQLENVTFSQPASPALLLLERPTGEEQLSQLRFGCPGGGPLQAGWTAAAAAGRSTVSDGLRRYLLRAEQAAECDPTVGGTEPGKTGGTGPRTAGGTQPQRAGGTQPQRAGGTQPRTAGGTEPQKAGGTEPQKAGGSGPQAAASSQLPAPTGSSGAGLFTDPVQVGLELLILALAVAVVMAIVAAAVVARRRRQRSGVADAQILVEASDVSEE